MRLLSGLHKAPFALACWMGVAGSATRRGARILVGHGTPRAKARELERQLRYLRRRFRVVPLPALVACLEDAGADPGAGVDGMVALTFDDGLRSNVEVAYPILRRLGIPATFFVCPGLVEEGRLLWTHEARLRLRAMGQDADPVVEWMKGLDTPRRRAVEDALRRETPRFRPDGRELEEVALASWDALRGLDPAIVTIGSHSLTHPILTGCAPDELRTEVRGSRALLEERLQRPVEFFCYPNGDHDAAVVREARAAYRAAFADGGRGLPRRPDLHALPRLDVPRGALRLASRLHRASGAFAGA